MKKKKIPVKIINGLEKLFQKYPEIEKYATRGRGKPPLMPQGGKEE